MKKLVLSLPLFLILAGCNSMEGTLTTHQPLELKLKNGKSVTVSTGTYTTEAKVAKDGRELKLKVKDVLGKDRSVTLKTPEGVRLPTNEGVFMMRGSEIGQSWNLRGELSHDVTKDEPIHAIEACTYTRTVYVCDGWHGRRYSRRYPRDYDHRWPGDYYGDSYDRYGGQCRHRTITFHGYQEVTYHMETATRTVELEFSHPDTSAMLGMFTASHVKAYRVYDAIGVCK